MTKLTRNYLRLCIAFILTPPIAAGLFIWTAHKLSVDTQAAVLSNILWPTTGAVFIAAIIGWAVFLRQPKQLSDGRKAGLLTVFLCYLLAPMPMAIEAGSWDGIIGVAKFYVTVFVLGQIVSFWVTYPIGAIFGRWIAKRMI